MITIVGVPRAFVGRHTQIQELAIQSWVELGRVLLFGDDDGIGDASERFGCRWVPEVPSDDGGRPFLDVVFARAQQMSVGDVVVYANSDILIPPTYGAALEQLARTAGSFLAVVPRLELQFDAADEFEGVDPSRMLARARETGLVAPPSALDVFAFPAGQLEWMPQFAVGRAGWDGWMVYDARRRDIPVVDLGKDNAVVHLDTQAGYASGKEHVADAATERSRRLAGWGATFTRAHATHVLREGHLVRRRARGDRSWIRGEAALRPWLRTVLAPARRFLRRRRGGTEAFYAWPPATPDRPEGGPT